MPFDVISKHFTQSAANWQWATVLYVKRPALLRADLGAIWGGSALRRQWWTTRRPPVRTRSSTRGPRPCSLARRPLGVAALAALGSTAIASWLTSVAPPVARAPLWNWRAGHFRSLGPGKQLWHGRGGITPARGDDDLESQRFWVACALALLQSMSMRALSTATEHALYNTFRELCVGSQY